MSMARDNRLAHVGALSAPHRDSTVQMAMIDCGDPKYVGADFIPMQYDVERGTGGAGRKAKAANYFVRFFRAGCPWTIFSEWFYEELHLHFGHIAHYDRQGFYAEWFSSVGRQRDFLEDLCQRWTAGVGDPAYTYSDVVRAIRAWVSTSGILDEYRIRADEEKATAAVAAARAALAALTPEQRASLSTIDRSSTSSAIPHANAEVGAGAPCSSGLEQLGFVGLAS